MERFAYHEGDPEFKLSTAKKTRNYYNENVRVFLTLFKMLKKKNPEQMLIIHLKTFTRKNLYIDLV